MPILLNKSPLCLVSSPDHYILIAFGQIVPSPSCHAPWAKDSLDNFKQFLGSAELASSESKTTNQIALFAMSHEMSCDDRTGFHSTAG